MSPEQIVNDREPLLTPERHQTPNGISAAERLLAAIEAGKDPDGDIIELIGVAANTGEVSDRITADEVGGLSIVDQVAATESVPLLLGEQPVDELGLAMQEISEARGPQAVETIILRIEKAEQEFGAPGSVELIDHRSLVERSANYEGNWTEAQTERMKRHDFLRRVDRFIVQGATGMKEEPGLMDRQSLSRQGYLDRIDTFTRRHEKITTQVGYGPAIDHGFSRTELGFADYENNSVTLFTDAEHDDTPLDSRQKDIIAAHEMYHALINVHGENVSMIREGFDAGEITEYNTELKEAGVDKRAPSKYMMNPDELMARMAQVKNYFGMKGEEPFTQAHLDYAREHYVADTGLDNSMTLFFRMTKDEEFIVLMNTAPI